MSQNKSAFEVNEVVVFQKATLVATPVPVTVPPPPGILPPNTFTTLPVAFVPNIYVGVPTCCVPEYCLNLKSPSLPISRHS